MKKANFIKFLVVFSIVSLISACGGGGGSVITPGEEDSTITGVELDGVAAKGIISNGLVTAYELDGSGNVLRTVGTANTDANGRYSMSLNDSYGGGLIRLEVTSSAQTTLVCDAASGCGTRTDTITDDDSIIDFGEQYKPAGLSMTAMIPSAVQDAEIAVQITPFTHMAAKRAMSSATLDSAAINNANSEVSQLIGGLDILSVEPMDVTDSTSLANANASQIAYAALGASIAELAPDDANGQPDIEAVLTTLATNFSDGTLASVDSGDSDDTIALQEIIDEATAALAETSSTDTSGVLDDLQEDVTTAGGGEIDPEPSDNAGNDDVTKAKAFIADLSTWGAVIESELSAPSEAFATQIALAGEATNMIARDPTSAAVGYATLAIFQYLFDEIDYVSEFVDASGDNPFTAGTLSSSGGNYSLTAATLVIDGQSADLDMTLTLPVDGTSGTEFTFGVSHLEVDSDFSHNVVDNGTITVTLSEVYTVDYAALSGGTAAEPSAPTRMALDIDETLTQKMTINSEGDQVVSTDPISIVSGFETVIHLFNDAEGVLQYMSPGSFTLSGQIANQNGDSFEMTLTASVPNAGTWNGDYSSLIANWGLQFTTQFDGVPSVNVSVTANNNDYYNTQGDGVIILSYGDRVLRYEGSNYSDTGQEGGMTITNQDGVSLTLNFLNLNDETVHDTAADIEINGSVVGTVLVLEDGSLKISYIDGTFEIR